MRSDTDWTFYAGFGLVFAFMGAVLFWLVKDYLTERKNYPLKNKKEK